MVSHQVSWFPSPLTEDDELFCGIVTFDLTSHWHPTLTCFPDISLKLGDKIWGRRPSYKAWQVLDYVTVLEGEVVIHSLSLSLVTRCRACGHLSDLPHLFSSFLFFCQWGYLPKMSTPTPKMSTFKESSPKMSTPNNYVNFPQFKLEVRMAWEWDCGYFIPFSESATTQWNHMGEAHTLPSLACLGKFQQLFVCSGVLPVEHVVRVGW